MMKITRTLARDLSTIFRRALDLSPRHCRSLTIQTIVGQNVRLFRAATLQYAVEYREPSDQRQESLLIPYELLHTVAGNRPEEVHISSDAQQGIVARWHEKAVPQVRSWPEPDPEAVKPFPDEPESWAANTPDLLPALQHAHDTTDAQSTRYALGCIQFRGATGALAATDGRQMLLQRGYQFGFEDDVLARPTAVFNASQLPSDSPVLIGRVEKHLCVRTGAWTFWLPIETEARFPRVDDIIPRTAMMPNLVEVHPADAQFLTENLPRLPQQETDSGIVTLDLNGSVLVRSRSSGDSPSTELRLSNSLKTGDDLRVVSDRRYLSRAMALGLTRWHLANADSPMLAQDERRSYVWALWDKGSAVKPSEDALVVESPVARAVRTAVSPAPLPAPAAPLPPTPTPPAPVLRSMTMPRQKPIPAMPEQTMDTMSIVEQQDTNTSAASPIEQAIRLRGVLRDALTATNDLIGSLKRQQKQQRAYKSAIASLRELQGVA